ncbi:MAG: hypothetical protein U1E16_04855 [Hyphomicrobiales bacterium]
MTIDIGRHRSSLRKSPKGDICQVTSKARHPTATARSAACRNPTRRRAARQSSARPTTRTVTVLDATSSEANNMVTLGVGPDKAKWKCLVKNGIVEVMSLTDEGGQEAAEGLTNQGRRCSCMRDSCRLHAFATTDQPISSAPT